MFDWIITGGKVIDGTGAQPFPAAIAVQDDRIAAIGNLGDALARNIYDAKGCYICPGFIDVHSHSDTFLLCEPSAPSKIYQGITTEVVGNCGASAAPIENQSQLPFDWQLLSYPGKWQSFRDYLQLLEQCRPAVNVVPLVGHNRIRITVMGYSNRKPSDSEMRAMTRLLETSLDEGAWGLSTGLIYRPGKFASNIEIAELARSVARRNGVYTSHIRNEGSRLLEAISEAIEVGRKTGVKVQISHLKTSGSNNWHLVDDALAMIDRARNEGIDVTADRYPYIFSCTDLDIILPDWLTSNDRDGILGCLREQGKRSRLRDELAAERPESYWDDIIVGTSSEAGWRGQSVRTIATGLKVEPAEAVIVVLEKDKLQTQAFFAGMNEANLWKILAQPYVMIGTDASLRSPRRLFADDHPHPRAYGTFPRFLRAALDGKTVSLPEAVRKMTLFPADKFGIRHRGSLKVGNIADIVLFDPAVVRDLSTFANPHQFSTGIRTVMINGAVVLAPDGLTGNRPGRVLAPEH